MTDDERKARNREKMARWRANNRERALAQGRADSKKHHAAHRDEVLAAMRAGYKKNRSARRAYAKAKWALLNRDDESARRKNLWETHKAHWNALRYAKRAADPETARRRRREWRAANAEVRRVKESQWRASPEQRAKALARTIEWTRRNPERARALMRKVDAKRRALQHDAFVEAVDPRIVFTRDGGICGICMKPVDPASRWEVDHIVPIARGGLHSYTNVQLAHRRCNRLKGAKLCA